MLYIYHAYAIIYANKDDGYYYTNSCMDCEIECLLNIL